MGALSDWVGFFILFKSCVMLFLGYRLTKNRVVHYRSKYNVTCPKTILSPCMRYSTKLSYDITSSSYRLSPMNSTRKYAAIPSPPLSPLATPPSPYSLGPLPQILHVIGPSLAYLLHYTHALLISIASTIPDRTTARKMAAAMLSRLRGERSGVEGV
jgi:hypothetical protein